VSDTVEEQVNRLAQQMQQLAQMQKISYKSFAEVTELENRRFALSHASKLMAHANSMGGLTNAASILGVAEMYANWLNDGTMPNLPAFAADTAQFAWNLLLGGFTPEVVGQAKTMLQDDGKAMNDNSLRTGDENCVE